MKESSTQHGRKGKSKRRQCNGVHHPYIAHGKSEESKSPETCENTDLESHFP